MLQDQNGKHGDTMLHELMVDLGVGFHNAQTTMMVANICKVGYVNYTKY